MKEFVYFLLLTILFVKETQSIDVKSLSADKLNAVKRTLLHTVTNVEIHDDPDKFAEYFETKEPKIKCNHRYHCDTYEDHCISIFQLCNGYEDCIDGEDESPMHCLFHRMQKSMNNMIIKRLNDIEDKITFLEEMYRMEVED